MLEFSKKIIIQTIIIFVVGIFPYLSWGGGIEKEIIIAFALSLLNCFVGYFIVLKSVHLNNAQFNKNVYGTMLIRLIFIVGATLYLINSGIVKMVPFFILLMVFYIVHQWTEITSWLKLLPSRKAE